MLQDTPMANRLLEMFVQHYEELFEETKNSPAYAAPVSEPQKKIDFMWRSSRPPTQVSPLAGYDIAAESMASAKSVYLFICLSVCLSV